MTGKNTKTLCVSLAGAAMVLASTAHAQENNWYKELFGGIGIGGFFQLETAFRTTSQENPNNQRGNKFNGISVARMGQAQPTSAAAEAAGLPITPLISDTVQRGPQRANNTFNLTLLRSEIDLEWPILSNVRLKATVRSVFDVNAYDNYDADLAGEPFPGDAVGILQNDNGVNLFEYRYDSNQPRTFTGLDQTNEQIVNGLQKEEGSSPLEFAGENYLVDFPNLYLDIEFGPVLLRVGNQQIAWGDAIFFRVLDVPNGLDFRRHSVLDFVAEEFSDKRLPALGIRASITAPSPLFFLGTPDWEYDAFVQRFRSNILGNPNTPYNVIPSQFTVHDRFKDVDNKYNFGLRVKGAAGPVDLQFIAARIYNPAGVFHWTASGVDRDGAGIPGSGAILARSAFEADPTGVVSAAEFSFYGGLARLDHANGLNEVIENFPDTALLGASVATSNEQQLRQEDLFFQLTGGLRGHLARDYFRENNFGFGISHKFEAAGGSFFDQIIGSVEVKYVPDRVFTPIDLAPERDEFIEEDEVEAAVVFTNFYRVSEKLPSAFLVLQYLYRSESDLFGRHLSGYGGAQDRFPGNTNFADDIINENDPGATNIGRSNYQAVAFAFQQPFPNRVYVVDFASLYDLKGGLLLQPSLTWKPNGAIRVQAFYNFVDTIRGQRNNNALDTATFADELTLRLTYQF